MDGRGELAERKIYYYYYYYYYYYFLHYCGRGTSLSPPNVRPTPPQSSPSSSNPTQIRSLAALQ
jgi:hypothetical protein